MAEIIPAENPISKPQNVEPLENQSTDEQYFTHPILSEMTDVALDALASLQTPLNSESEGNTAGPLPNDGISVEDVCTLLQELVQFEESDSGRFEVELQQLDTVGQLALVSQTLAGFLSTLPVSHLKHVATRLISDTTLWIGRLFRFFDGSALYHEDPREGIVKICRLVLLKKYPKYIKDGYEALYPRPPVIYISAAAKSSLGQHICTQLGLPQSCLNIVPCNTVFGSQHTMDVATLERLIQEDLSGQKIPVIVLGNAGSSITGHVDNLVRLQEICKQNDMWLHVDGHSLAALGMMSVVNVPARAGDSMTLPIGTWLGVPSLPRVTLYKSCETPLVHAAGLSSFNLPLRLSCLPLWATLQVLGHNGVQSRLRQAFEMSEHMERHLQLVPNIRIVSQFVLASEKEAPSISDLLTKPVNTAMLFEIVSPCVVFQFVNSEALTEKIVNPPYFNNLNSWLGQIIQRDYPQFPIEIVDVESCGYCIRYCPLENSGKLLEKEDIDQFLVCMEQQLKILNATVKHRETFQEKVQHISNLELVYIDNWAGLGGVRYIPENWVGSSLEQLPDQGKEEVKRLNIELVQTLKSTDAAFSLGEGVDRMVCVRFGMVTAETDTQELIALVLAVGKEIEESSRYLESMTELVKKGIETVTEDLKKENDEKLWQEGILRHVPIVGSFVNWWSPPTKEFGVKGRSLNLTAGVVESTENIYKYHMQLNAGSPQSSPNTKLPPQPLVQTPIQHSRSSSHSSHSSHTAANQIPSDSVLKPTASSTLDASSSPLSVSTDVGATSNNVEVVQG